MENSALHWRVQMCACVNVGGGNIIVDAHLHRPTYGCIGLPYCFSIGRACVCCRGVQGGSVIG